MKSRLATAAALLGTLVATPVFAQEGAAPPTATGVATTTEARHGLTLGAQLELMPMGTGKISGDLVADESLDLKTAYAIGGLVAYDVTPNVSIGLAPRLILGVAYDVPDAAHAKELDLRARLAVHGESWHRVHVYGYAAPGFTRFLPEEGKGTNGFTIGFGAGVAYDVTPRYFVNAELGYQLAYFGQDIATLDQPDVVVDRVDLVFSYAHVGLGAGARF